VKGDFLNSQSRFSSLLAIALRKSLHVEKGHVILVPLGISHLRQQINNLSFEIFHLRFPKGFVLSALEISDHRLAKGRITSTGWF
jgi:hypothetical protein